MSEGGVETRYICPDAPAQVTAIWHSNEVTNCPWCGKPLTAHGHYLWSIVTGSSSGVLGSTETEEAGA